MAALGGFKSAERIVQTFTNKCSKLKYEWQLYLLIKS